jgi:hypothetical protein
MDYYADVVKDPTKVQAVFDILNEKGFISMGAHYSPFINVLLNLVSWQNQQSAQHHLHRN